MEDVLQFYDSYFVAELKVFYDFVKQHFGLKRGISETNIQELASRFVDHDRFRLFLAVTMLFKIYLCSSHCTTAERCFSALKRKTWLRTRMTWVF